MHGLNFVYDIAFELEDDLKDLSSSLGKEATASLIHKIVNVLEELEQHSQHYEWKDKQIFELKEAIKNLEKNKICKEQERIDHQKDLEKMEEAWHMESMELMRTLETLEEENNALKSLMHEALKKPRVYNRRKFGEELEIKSVHLKLKETIDLQIEELKSLKKEISQKCLDIDAMQQQCLNLSNINAEICENYCHSKMKTKRLMEEKASLEARLVINSHSSGAAVNNDDVFTDQVSSADNAVFYERHSANIGWEEMKGYLQERDRLRSEVTVRKEQLLVFRPRTYDDAEVQGPINKEPREKMSPWSPKGFGIKRFFQRFVPIINE